MNIAGHVPAFFLAAEVENQEQHLRVFHGMVLGKMCRQQIALACPHSITALCAVSGCRIRRRNESLSYHCPVRSEWLSHTEEERIIIVSLPCAQ